MTTLYRIKIKDGGKWVYMRDVWSDKDEAECIANNHECTAQVCPIHRPQDGVLCKEWLEASRRYRQLKSFRSLTS